ncbi:hypothetical protein [Spiroplasma platyhelix]|uniref:Uncharacterized protein n=1 Tax=Spiroplasma platyhelix PALS-1 TaxID=1276218 RepID=A0A846U1W6_9MOLU|nr:hypothetical protein [Spiroplasma platyhelix]MBE4704129.1 hypothetical protein [Spiroplasma platyhelix PALS-1]NKE38499.1 hypothetical protein [Spiroplasma platyhelix PALS-1]UJB29387.1 hypothetical protein SPLAT_v1c06230 [Spiroplasma platyhelix PALS-1]
MKEKAKKIKTLKHNTLENSNLVAYATIEQLNNESKLRANTDILLNNSINLLSKDYQDYKTTNDPILNNKQSKIDTSLATSSKVIVEAINEINAQIITTVDKSYLDEQHKILQNNINIFIESITKMIDQLEAKIYTKFKEVTINNDWYFFDDYDETYWHLFVFEFETITKAKIIGVLERPSHLNSEIPSHNVVLDYSATSSLNLIFTASKKILEIKNWLEARRKIIKITIYRKKI